MTNRRWVLVGFFLSMLLSGAVYSQETETINVGVFGHYLLNNHSADFPHLPATVSCCSTFTGGSGTGYGLGIHVETPLDRHWNLAARLTYLHQGFDMVTPEPTFLIINGAGQNGTFEHRLNGSINSIGVEPMATYALTNSLRAVAALHVATILTSVYEQKEQITQPSGVGTFLNPDGSDSHQRIRNVFTGSLQNTSLQIGAILGMSYDLPLNSSHTMVLSPELWYQQAFSNVTSDVQWTASCVRIGASIRYRFLETKQKRHLEERQEVVDTLSITQTGNSDKYVRGVETSSTAMLETEDRIRELTTVRRTDTMYRATKQPTPLLRASLRTVSVDSLGREYPLATIKIEEFISTQMNPLLAYVFFDHGSAVIPSRYHVLATNDDRVFDPQSLREKQRLDMYHDLLNIVGYRLRQNSKAHLHVVGCTDDNDSENANTELARQRADVVRVYLMQHWNIAADRISVDARHLPLSASNPLVKDGAEENRRVELSSDADDILAPLIITDTLRVATPALIRVVPEVHFDAGVDSWLLTFRQHDRKVREFSGSDMPPTYVEWRLGDTPQSMPTGSDSINVRLRATDKKDSLISTSASLAVDFVSLRKKKTERRGDMEIDRYSLILFDVRSAKFSEANQRIISFVRDRLREQSAMNIRGYTDRLGDATYNQSLAESRAKATATQFTSLRDVRVDAKGNSNLYDNDLPEGRFYSRTVDIEVVTPIKE